jgi:hypothetical protein
MEGAEPKDGEVGYICATCRDWVDPSDPGVMRAYELRRVDSFGGRDVVEGLASYFHVNHFPGGPGWRVDHERPDLA